MSITLTICVDLVFKNYRNSMWIEVNLTKEKRKEKKVTKSHAKKTPNSKT